MQGRGNAEQPRCPAMHSRGATFQHHTASSYAGSTEIPLFFKDTTFWGGDFTAYEALSGLPLQKTQHPSSPTGKFLPLKKKKINGVF